MNKDLETKENKGQLAQKIVLLPPPSKPRSSSMKVAIKSIVKKQSRADQVADNKPTLKIFQDSATQNMKNLKQVKFLSVDANQINQLVDAKPILEKTGQLAKEYLTRKQTIDASVQKVIKNSNIAHMEILKKNERDKEIERKRKAEERSNSSPLVAGLLGSIESENSPKKGEDSESNKLADGFVRSNRNVALKVKNQIDIQMQELEHDKTRLVQKLNDALIKLDGLNTNKRLMSQKLVEQIQFVRDLHKATGGAGVDDIQTIVSQEIKNEYKREKELHKVLDDQLTRADQERTSILERLKLFTGEKEVVVINQDGQRRSFKVTSVNIERLINGIRDTKVQIAQMDHAIARAREIFTNSEQDIQIRERQVQALSAERQMIFERTQDYNQRHDHAVVALQHDRHRAHHMHKMHVKLLSMRIFEESIQKVLCRNREITFNHLKQICQIRGRKQDGLLTFRKVLLNTQYKYARKLLHLWHWRVYDPIKRGVTFSKLPVFYDKQELMTYFYYKWQALYQAKSTRKLSIKQSSIRIQAISQKQDLKLQQIFLFKWRRHFSDACTKLKTLLTRINAGRIHRLENAMQKWRSVLEDQLFTARMLSLSVQFNEKQMERLVFSAWQGFTITSKNKARALKSRVLKNFRVYLMRKKFLRLMDGKTIILDREKDLRMKQKVLNALKYFKTASLFMRINNRIQDEINPSINGINGDTAQYHLTQEQKVKYRALCTLVIKPTMRLVNEYFSHWQTIAEQGKWVFTEGFKKVIIKFHQIKLQAAFNHWRTQRSQVVMQQQKRRSDMIIQEIVLTQQEKGKADQKIYMRHKLNKALGFKQLRKVTQRVMSRYLKQQFVQWKNATLQQQNKERSLANAFKSYQKRLFRISFGRFQEFTRSERILANNQFKVKNLNLRKQSQTIRTIFKAILSYSKKRTSCTDSMRHLTQTIDKHNQRVAFKLWCADTRHGRETNLFQTEKEIVSHLDLLQNEMGKLQDNFQKTNQSKERLTNILKLECKEIIKKWFMRFHYGGLQYGFKTWHKTTLNLKHRNNYLLSLVQHQAKNTLRQTFSRWLNLKHRQIKDYINDFISKKVLDVRENDFTVQLAKLDTKKSVNEIGAKIQIVQKALNEKTRTFVKTFGTLIGTKERNFLYNKLRLYLNGWRQFTRNRNKSCKVLERGITRMMLQKAFNLIQKLHQQENLKQKQNKISHNVDKVMSKMILRLAINKWNNYHFQQAKYEIMTTQESRQQHVEVGRASNVAIQESYVAKIESTNSQASKTQNFRLWKACVVSSKKSNAMIQQFAELERQRITKKSLHLMNQRAKLTEKYRDLVRRFTETQNLKLLKTCFQSGFQRERQIDNQFGKILESIFEKSKSQKLELAFNKIKYTNEITNICHTMQKTQTVRQLFKSLDKMHTKRMRQSLEQLRQNTHFDKANYLKLKACLMIKPMISLRSWFLQWKSRAIKKSVAAENEEGCGPVNLEAWNSKLENFNLMSMLIDDGQTPEFVANLVEETSKKQLGLIEKTVTRMMIFQDEDLRLMPYFLDRLRSYAIIRKKWRKSLGIIELKYKRVMRVDNRILIAFKTWNKFCSDHKKFLEATTLTLLVQRYHNNRMLMNQVAEVVEDKIQTTEVMTEQRDVLFTGYVGARRLALGYTKAHFDKIKQRAIMRFNDQGNKSLQSKIQFALDQNLNLIEALKNKVYEKELQNQQIARSNDHERQPAMEAVHGARDLEALQIDIDRMNYELSGQADTIGRLIEDNQYLNKRLEDKQFDNVTGHHEANQSQRLHGSQENYSALKNKVSMNRTSQIQTYEKQLQPRFQPTGSAPLRSPNNRASGSSPLRLVPVIRQ